MAPLFGLHNHNFTYADGPPDGLFEHTARMARAAEDAGFDLITVMDH